MNDKKIVDKIKRTKIRRIILNNEWLTQITKKDIYKTSGDKIIEDVTVPGGSVTDHKD